MRPKGKSESKDESDEAPKSINCKLVRAIQKYEKEQEEDSGLNGASPLSEEILAETFLTKFKLPSLDRYDGTTDLKSHLLVFMMTMQLQDLNALHAIS